MEKMIWFDMDGTIADLYAVDGWLGYLQNNDTTPYDIAPVMHNMALLAKMLNKIQRMGHKIGIISWTSKNGTDLYNGEVALSKVCWLNKHLHSVQWDEIKIVPYGTCKKVVCGDGILFDDEERNRNEWGNNSYTPDNIFPILKALIREG